MLAAKTDDEAQALYYRFSDALCDGTSLGVTCQDLRHQRDVEARTNMAQITIDVAAGDLHCSPWPLVDCAKVWRQVVSSSNPEDIIAYEALGCTPP
jgi:hypothetical protein